jgi:hypothetical protein
MVPPSRIEEEPRLEARCELQEAPGNGNRKAETKAC